MNCDKKHIGQNIRKMRELRGFKQEALGFELGISQKKVSHLEHQECVTEDVLLQIANILQVSPQVIKQFTEEAFINYCENISNPPVEATEIDTHNDPSLHASPFIPHDKIFELYERLLQAEREKLAYVEKFMNRL